jgi:LPS-assembly protein
MERHRLFLLLLSFLSYTSEAKANAAAWNCEQSKDGKEWICSGDAKPAEIAPVTPKIEPPVVESEPAAAPAIVETKPVEVEKIIVPAVEKPVDNAVQTPEPIIVTPAQIEKARAEEQKNQVAPVSVQTENTNSGAGEWKCGAGQGSEWNCQQTKKAAVSENGEVTHAKTSSQSSKSWNLGVVPAAFDATQEQTFNVLKSQLKVDPWAHCTNPNAPKPVYQSSKKTRTSSPVDVTSNYSEIFENEISSYFGNVRIKRGDQQVLSNAANYDSVTEKLAVEGDVFYSDDDMAVHTDAATFDLNSDKAKLRDVLFIAPTAPLRGHAGAIYRENKEISHYQDVAYTSCPTGNQDWVVHAGELKIDREEGTGTAQNAWLEFKGVPVFYSPYLRFPTDSRRKSGFLAPSFGNTDRAGFSASVPYYWNISPDMDATFRPRYLTKRGALLAGEFRYLTEDSYGETKIEFMPTDYKRDDKARYFGSFKDTTRLGERIQANVDLNFVSDKNYFAELGSALSLPNFSYLKSQADVGYYGDKVTAVGRVENYQSIDLFLTGDRLPYRKLPQVNVNLKHAFEQLPMPVNVGMDNEFVYFQHTHLRNGQRSNLKPFLSVPLQSESAYITPKIALQYTHYFLSDPEQNILSANANSWQISRTLPIFSTDSGITFERNVNVGGKGFLNTLEPRLFYLYIPHKNQDAIDTMFDTAAYDVWFNTLFRENRFSGIDRMQDANQLTAAITSRLIDEKTGQERMKFSLGNTFYFQDRMIQAPLTIQKLDSLGNPELNDAGRQVFENFTPPAETNLFSNVIGEFNARINDHIAIDSGVQWNPHQAEISRGKAMLHLTGLPNEILNLGYRYRTDTTPDELKNRKDLNLQSIATGISQTDVSFHYPIYDNWSAIGRWQYSLLYNSTQESFFGIEKENCCWRFRVVGRRYLNNLNAFYNGVDVQGDSQTGVFFQVELKGLTGMGENLDTFLEQNIYGFRSK